MAVTFTGTKTRQPYVAGRVYANGNGAYRANLDGSFTRLSNGGTLDGSSQDERTVWATTGGAFLGTGQRGREAAVAYALGGGGSATSGPGARRVRTGNGGTGAGVEAVVSGAGPGTGPGVPVAKSSGAGFLDPGTLAGLRRDAVTGGGVFDGTGKPEKITDIYIDGWKYPRSGRTSDAADVEDALGEAEFPSIAWVVVQAANIDNLWQASPYKPAVDEWAASQRERLAKRDAAIAADLAAQEKRLDEGMAVFSENYGFATSGWPRYTTGGGF